MRNEAIRLLIDHPSDAGALEMASCACEDDPRALGALLECAAREQADGARAARLLVESARLFIDPLDDLDWAESLLSAALDRHPQCKSARELLDDVLVSLAKHTRQTGQLSRCGRHLQRLLVLRGGDAGIEEALARLVIARLRAGEGVPWSERQRAAERFVALSVGRDEAAQLELCALSLELDPDNEDALIRVLAGSSSPNPELTPLLARCLDSSATPSNDSRIETLVEDATDDAVLEESNPGASLVEDLAPDPAGEYEALVAGGLAELKARAREVLGEPEAGQWLAAIAGPRIDTTVRDLLNELARGAERVHPPRSGLRPPAPPSMRSPRPAQRTGA